MSIGILFTGGTIAMRVDPVSGAASPSMSAADIVAQVPTLGQVADFEIEEFSRPAAWSARHPRPDVAACQSGGRVA